MWLAASHAAEGHSGAFFFDRAPVRTHWIPTTRETKAEREAYWKLARGFEGAG